MHLCFHIIECIKFTKMLFLNLLLWLKFSLWHILYNYRLFFDAWYSNIYWLIFVRGFQFSFWIWYKIYCQSSKMHKSLVSLWIEFSQNYQWKLIIMINIVLLLKFHSIFFIRWLLRLSTAPIAHALINCVPAFKSDKKTLFFNLYRDRHIKLIDRK